MGEKMKKVILACLCCVILIISGVLAANQLKKAEENSGLIKTAERNFRTEASERVSYIVLHQDGLFADDADLIFKGTHTRSEHYTYPYINDDDGQVYKNYFSVFYFKVNKIYFGDKNLLNKEISFVTENFPPHEDTVLLKENSEYIIFGRKYDNPRFFNNIKFIYGTGTYQMVFEIYGSKAMIMDRTLGYYFPSQSEVPENVIEFRNAWIEKQAGEKIDDFSFDNIKLILNINEITVESENGTTTRFAIDKEIFEDLIYEAINYYKAK